MNYNKTIIEYGDGGSLYVNSRCCWSWLLHGKQVIGGGRVFLGHNNLVNVTYGLSEAMCPSRAVDVLADMTLMIAVGEKSTATIFGDTCSERICLCDNTELGK